MQAFDDYVVGSNQAMDVHGNILADADADVVSIRMGLLVHRGPLCVSVCVCVCMSVCMSVCP
jgi:hypothetical protein